MADRHLINYQPGSIGYAIIDVMEQYRDVIVIHHVWESDRIDRKIDRKIYIIEKLQAELKRVKNET